MTIVRNHNPNNDPTMVMPTLAMPSVAEINSATRFTVDPTMHTAPWYEGNPAEDIRYPTQWRESEVGIASGYGARIALTEGRWVFNLFAYDEATPPSVDTGPMVQQSRQRLGFGAVEQVQPASTNTSLVLRDAFETASVECATPDKVRVFREHVIQPGDEVQVSSNKPQSEGGYKSSTTTRGPGVSSTALYGLPPSFEPEVPRPEIYVTRIAEESKAIVEIVRKLAHGKLSEDDAKLLLATVETQFAGMAAARNERREQEWQKTLAAFNANPFLLRGVLIALGRAPKRQRAAK